MKAEEIKIKLFELEKKQGPEWAWNREAAALISAQCDGVRNGTLIVENTENFKSQPYHPGCAPVGPNNRTVTAKYNSECPSCHLPTLKGERITFVNP